MCIIHKIYIINCLIFDISNRQDGEKIFARQIRGVELPNYQTAENELVRLGTLTKDQIQLQDGLNHRLKEYALTTDAANYSAKDFYQSQVKVTSGFWGGIKAINMYNAQADSVSRGKMAEAILETNNALGSQLVQLNGAKASLAAYVKDSAWSALKNMGAQIVSGLASAGISMIISGTIGLITNLIQKQKELKEQIMQTADEAVNETNQIKSLYGEYSEALNAYDHTAETKENLTSKTDELLKALGLEEDEIKALKGNYGELDEAINSVSIDALDKNYEKAFTGYNTALDEMVKKTKNTFSGGNSIFLKGASYNNPVLSYLRENGYEFEADRNGKPVWSFDVGEIKDYESAAEALKKLKELKEVLSEGRDNGIFSKDEYAFTELNTAINERISDIEKYYKKVDEYRNTANDALAQSLYIETTDKSGIPETQEQFDSLRESMIKTANESDKYKNRFIGSNEEIIDSIDSVLNTMPDLSDFVIGSNNEDAVKKNVDNWVNIINKAFNERYGYFSEDKWNIFADVIPELNPEELSALLQLVQGEIDNNIDWLNIKPQELKEKLGEFSYDSRGIESFKESITTFTEETYSGLQDVIDKYNSATTNLGKLSASEVEELIKTDSTLIGKFTSTAEGYEISLGDLRASREKFLADQEHSTKEEIKQLENYINDQSYLRNQLVNGGISSSSDAAKLNEYDDNISAAKEMLGHWKLYLDYIGRVNNGYEEEAALIKKNIEAQSVMIKQINEEIEKQKEKREQLEEQKELLEEQATQYESAANAVTRQIDKQIEALEKQKSLVEDYYDKQIDALKEEAEERDRINELREKELALEKAKNTKVRVYSKSRGWTIQTDSEAVNQAQKDYDDTVRNNQIEDLEKEKEAALANYDAQIEAWNNYKDSWQEAIDAWKNGQDEMNAAAVFGADWREKVARKDLEMVSQYKTEYGTIQDQIKDITENQLVEIDKEIERLEKKLDVYENLKKDQQEYLDFYKTYSSEFAKATDEQTAALKNFLEVLKSGKDVQGFMDMFEEYEKLRALFDEDYDSNEGHGLYTDKDKENATYKPSNRTNSSAQTKLNNFLNSKLMRSIPTSVNSAFAKTNAVFNGLPTKDYNYAQTKVNNNSGVTYNQRTWNMNGSVIVDSYDKFKEYFDRYVREAKQDLAVGR